MITMLELGWLAGIVEGEGCITYTRTPVIAVKMTDEDVIKKVAKLFNRPYYERKNKEFNHRTAYDVSICGTPAIEWLFTLYSLLGSRRKAKILEVINEWKKQELIFFAKDKFGCGDPKTPENTYWNGRLMRCRKCALEKDKRYRKTA